MPIFSSKGEKMGLGLGLELHISSQTAAYVVALGRLAYRFTPDKINDRSKKSGGQVSTAHLPGASSPLVNTPIARFSCLYISRDISNEWPNENGL